MWVETTYPFPNFHHTLYWMGSEQLVPKTTRTQDNSYPRQLVPRTTRTQDNSYPRQLVPMWYDMIWKDVIYHTIYHIISHHFTSLHITPHHTTPHYNTPHHTTSHHTTSHHILYECHFYVDFAIRWYVQFKLRSIPMPNDIFFVSLPIWR